MAASKRPRRLKEKWSASQANRCRVTSLAPSVWPSFDVPRPGKTNTKGTKGALRNKHVDETGKHCGVGNLWHWEFFGNSAVRNFWIFNGGFAVLIRGEPVLGWFQAHTRVNTNKIGYCHCGTNIQIKIGKHNTWN